MALRVALAVAAVVPWAAGFMLQHEEEPQRTLLSPRWVSPSLKVALLENADFQGPPFIFDHLAKTGGTFCKRVLRVAIPKAALGILKESDSLEELTEPVDTKAFKIGSIRSPYAYYVSLWGYGRYPGFPADLKPAGDDLFSEVNKQRFRKFVRTIMPEDIGVETFRFMFSYTAKPPIIGKRFNKVSAKVYFDEMMSAQQRESALNSLKAFTPSRLNCWIYTEMLNESMRSCLEHYGRSGGHVQWDAYTEAIQFKGTNPSTHATCGDYYDDATAQLVAEKDRAIFDMFNYSLNYSACV